ncbi:MAG: 50S ribosomal protein L11 methyltransferase [Deltaproteobacteria bacterium]|jgi:ribosomal protein L11 methyltransferase|nr:50S ribosomal protein L11 methyltransferase [Deltaproteobacteria bacterium]
MDPSTPLTIFELRALRPEALDVLDRQPPEGLFGPLAASLAGLHVEADFAFLFFVQEVDLSPFLAAQPLLELRTVHRLRYDQWQDGLEGRPLKVGPLTVRPCLRAVEVPAGQDELGGRPPERRPQRAARRDEPLDELLIDPGLAFGYGGHPTTKTCLEFLLRLYRPGPLPTGPPPATALDLGCGTGILALAAVRLGAAEALGVDHSHLAADAARRNVRLNRLEGRVKIERGWAQTWSAHPAELLTANLPLFVLRDLAALEAFKGRRCLIVSGLLQEEGAAFLDLLAPAFRVVDAVRSDRWASYLLQASTKV